MYIAPLPADVLLTAVPETEVGNRPGTGNDRHELTGDRCNVCVGRSVKEYSPPVASNGSRKERPQRDDNEMTPDSQRQRSQNLTRTMSDGFIGRYVGRQPESSKSTVLQCQTTTNDQRWSAERRDQTTKRNSLDEAEKRIENEVVEAMRREQELRYKATCITPHETL